MFKPWQVILFLLVVVLGVVGFIFWYYSAPGMNIDPNLQPVTTATAETPAAPDSATLTTDAALDADLGMIDAQLQAVSDDSAAVDQSMNDKPVAQTE